MEPCFHAVEQLVGLEAADGDLAQQLLEGLAAHAQEDVGEEHQKLL